MNDSHILTFKEWLKEYPEWRSFYHEMKESVYREAVGNAYQRYREEMRDAAPEEDGFPYHYTLPEE